MNVKVLVIDKVSETFDTKKGSKTLHLLVCQDQARPPLRNSFDYEMTAEEMTKYGATLVDKPIELNVRDMSQGFLGAYPHVGGHPQSRTLMETALTYTLQRVHWQFFGTLSFKSAKLPERVRVTMFFALVRCLCRWHKVPFRKCVWALRQEPGEISARLHFHFLVTGLPPYAVQVATCMSIKAQWERIGGGMARVRKYDSRKQGLEYTLKCLNVTNGGANLYEVGKFSYSADEVMLANSIWDPANLNRVSDTLVTA